jgi:hypothetical protein
MTKKLEVIFEVILLQKWGILGIRREKLVKEKFL